MTTILVIEDEQILREEVVKWLKLEDYETLSAPDGLAGVSEALAHKPDLIVCDITMPILDGHGVLVELRANPITADTPFIFVTARAAYEDLRQGMDLGADDYITKPFGREELLQAIRTRLGKKAVEENRREREVSLWKQALEEEKEQRQLKAKLIGMFSHDFRNPLTAIISSNSLLRDYGHRMDSEKQKVHFNRVEGCARQLVQMLDDMLVIAQMESNNLACHPEALNIQEFLHRIVEDFQLIHGETYQIVYECLNTDEVKADPRLLRQIASNLISNAIKYSPEGRNIFVFLERRDNSLILTVRDQGIGIPQSDQAHLFQAFQRASNVGSIRGTGLGLAIVQQAATLHGGRVDLKSQVGEGTTITVTLSI